LECGIDVNKANCNCTYEPCFKKGRCCECIVYHLKMDELPACAFPGDIEKTFDRSFTRFADYVSNKQ
jgi:hypothetical protein